MIKKLKNILNGNYRINSYLHRGRFAHTLDKHERSILAKRCIDNGIAFEVTDVDRVH